jgi:tripartite-type tricarboxylate transporter receptor subunit TctC
MSAARRHIVSCGALRAALAAVLAIGLAACGVENGSGGSSSDADDYPSKEVTFVAPMAPGGGTDLAARALAKAAERSFGESVVVVNKEGGNGAVGGKAVLNSRPDGYQMVLLPQSLLAIGPLFENEPGAIQLDDMSYVAPLTIEDYVLTAPASSPVRTLKDLLEQPSVKFGTTGAGTGSQLAQALLFAKAKVTASDVPFEGGSGLITALLGKQVDAGANQVVEAAPQIKAGKLRPLAVFAADRIPSLPNIKTAKEQGYDIVVNQRRWMAAPKDVPKDVLDSMRKNVETAKKDAGYLKFLKDSYVQSWDIAPDQVQGEVEAAKKQYADLVKRLGVNLTTD